MFKNEYQGGISVEILSPSGKNLFRKFKSHHAIREFDKDVKSFIYVLEGSTTVAKLQFPSDSKQLLGLIQRFLIIQVFIPLSKDFAVELMMTNINNSKRRVVLSSSSKDLASTPLHAKLPLSIIKRDIWLNLCLDMRSLTNDMFSNQTFKALEEFTVSGTCKVRRIFTMKSQPPDTTDIPDEYVSEPRESIPISLQFSHNVPFLTQVITVNKVRRFIESKDAKFEIRETSGYWSSSSDDLSNARKLSARDQTTRIAFGTKIAVDTPRGAVPRNGPNSARSERSQHLRSSDNHQAGIGPRKVQSSKARISCQEASSKKKQEPRLVGDCSMNKNPGTQRLKKLMKATRGSDSQTAEISEGTNERNLISLVDEIDLTDSQEKNDFSVNSAAESGCDSSKLFEFASQPHSLPRANTPIDADGEDVFASRSSSFQPTNEEERERIQQKILRATPTPRAATTSPRAYRSFLEANKKSNKSNSINPPSSLSPDLSLSQSGRTYDSAKYSEGKASHSEAVPSTDKSLISLKSSDATLTESVDTLVQTSLTNDCNIQRSAPDDASLNSSDLSDQHSNHGITVSCKNVREVSGKNETVQALPESSEYQVGIWDESFENNMLASMKRSVEEDMQDPDDDDDDGTSDDVAYQANFEDSFEISWSTYKNPPSMHPQAYDGEMKQAYPASGNTLNDSTLSQSNPRDLLNLLSPPLVLPYKRKQQKKESLSDAESFTNDYDSMALSDGSSCVSFKSSTTTGDTDEEEMLDLLYDPCLNCYFDPKNGKYYELKN